MIAAVSMFHEKDFQTLIQTQSPITRHASAEIAIITIHSIGENSSPSIIS